jgi:hypothetical protein
MRNPLEITDDEVMTYAEERGLTAATYFTRTVVQEVSCSLCKALPDSPCSNGRGRLRKSNHLERCFDRIRDHMAHL